MNIAFDTIEAKQPYNIRLPKESGVSLQQNEAYFFVSEDGQDHRLRLHDYDEIYSRPGLYEQLFYDRLQCGSPGVIADRLSSAMANAECRVEGLRVLDLGAGNGIMGEELKKLNASRVVGLDLIPEARDAALRDRPGVYDDYLVADMTALTESQRATLTDWRLDAVTCVAALGFDDIPADAFINAMEMVADDGWLAFTIKADFLEKTDQSGFGTLIRTLLYDNVIELHHMERYRHRLSIDGDWLFYFAMIARKRGPVGRSL